MPSARHLLALLRTHVQGDEQEFYSVAMQVAAQEARVGHVKLATRIRELIDTAKTERSQRQKLHVLEPKSELAALIAVQEPTERLSSLVLPQHIEARLRRVLLEHRQQRRLREHGLQP